MNDNVSVIIAFISQFRFNNPQPLSHRFDISNDLLLHEIKGHSQQRNTEKQVQRAQGYGYLWIGLDPLSGHEVPEADGGEGDEAEIRGIQERPVLPFREEKRPSEDIGHYQKDAQPDWDRFDLKSNIIYVVRNIPATI